VRLFSKQQGRDSSDISQANQNNNTRGTAVRMEKRFAFKRGQFFLEHTLDCNIGHLFACFLNRKIMGERDVYLPVINKCEHARR
jgi:hypothetical protein